MQAPRAGVARGQHNLAAKYVRDGPISAIFFGES